jgi:hypothetical protein
MKFKYWATDENFFDWKVDNSIKESSTDFFVAINDSLNIILIDPDYVVVNKSRKIDFLGKFNFYEILHASPIRAKSMRVLYNPVNKQLLTLNGTNTPIYNAWDDICATASSGRRKYLTKFNAYTYVKFFFNVVTGTYSRFELVDTFEHLKNRVNSFYNLNKLPQKKVPEYQDILIALTRLFQAHKMEILILDGYLCVKQVLMTFRRGLFIATVKINIKNKDKEYGHVSLADETGGRFNYNVDGTPQITFINVESNEENDAYILPWFLS